MVPTIILVETQLAENLGAVARCMTNFGLDRLRLVKPKINPLDPVAVSTAVGAANLLHEAEIFDSFEDAIADLKYVFATTACKRDMVKAYETPKSFVKLIGQSNFLSGGVGIVFGPERTGLLNDHIARCYKAITIPLNPSFPSLNLAQAVSIVAYEWFGAFSSVHSKKQYMHLGATKLAHQEDLNRFLFFLESHLDQANYWRVSSKKPTMWRNLINFFSKVDFTQQDLNTLYGVIDALRNRKSN
jgi:tRNA/rRNA methyltransferase